MRGREDVGRFEERFTSAYGMLVWLSVVERRIRGKGPQDEITLEMKRNSTVPFLTIFANMRSFEWQMTMSNNLKIS